MASSEVVIALWPSTSRPCFLGEAASPRQPLPPVDGSPVLRVLRADLTPCPFPVLFAVAFFTGLMAQVPAGPPKFPVPILQTCHVLKTPADPPESRPCQANDSFVLASASLNTVAICFVPVTRLYQTSGECLPSVACLVPCLRFKPVVRFPPSALTPFLLARLGTGDWLGLSR